MNLNRIFKRKPAGVSDGGQFAHDQKAESAVTLAAPPETRDTAELKMGEWTPYGAAEPFKMEAEGVQRFMTGDDGDYLRLSEERNAAIPEEYRSENRFYAAHDYYYGRPKADVMDVVKVTHPDAFEEEEVEWARDRIAVRDAPQDVQEDLSEIQKRSSIARDKADRVREEMARLEAVERKWAASTVAAGTLEHFPQAKEVSYLLHGDNLVGSVSVTDGEKTLGSLSMKQDGTIDGTGHEAGQEYLHTVVSRLEDVPDSWMAEQGAQVSEPDANGERVLTIDIHSALNMAAERYRDEDHRWRS